jgi:arylsulfatase A
MNRRTFLLGTALPACQTVLRAQPSRPPNMVIALADDLGYGDLGCMGNPAIQTPNLDTFARQGLRCTDFYSAAPVCSPSRAGLLTGRTPNRLGVYDWINPGNAMHLRREDTSFASALRSAGYRTAHFGKWHLNGKFNSPAQPQPGDHGFDYWFSTHNNAAPSHKDPDNFVRNGQPVGPLQGYSSRIIVEDALRWLDEQGNSSQPFCLFVCFHSPHEPIATAEEFSGMYPRATREGEALYYGNVSQLDHEFGRLTKRLDGIPNTLTLFTSDNGPETLNRYRGSERSYGTARPLRSMKLSLYEGGYRVPGLLRWPGRIKPGQVTRQPMATLDLAPTLLDLAAAPALTKGYDGASWSPMFLQGKKKLQRAQPLHWHYFNSLDAPTSSLRDGDWKIIGIPNRPPERRPGGGFRPTDLPFIKNLDFQSFELYNLRQDPAESTNLAPREPKRLQQMSDQLTRIHTEVRTQAPTW